MTHDPLGVAATPPAQPHHPSGTPEVEHTGPDGVGGAGTPDPIGLPALVANGDLDTVPGDPPVPITVWRVADPQRRPDEPDHGLTPRTAALLIGLYTRPGDTVVFLGDDPTVAGAAGAGGRTYRAVNAAPDLRRLRHLAPTITLLVVPWPQPHGPAGDHPTGEPDIGELARLLAAHRSLLTHAHDQDNTARRAGPDRYTVVAITLTRRDRIPLDQIRHVVPAARQEGWDWLQHIVAVTTPPHADPIDTSTPASTATRDAHHRRSISAHHDLLVFILRTETGRNARSR